MPYYSALPEYKPVTAGPFTSLIGGFSAGQGIQERGARAALEREALVKSQNERAALQKFQQTGDPNVLTSVMTPQQAMMAKEAHTQAQIETGLAVSNYFDSIKLDLTWENYPKVRADAIKRFPETGERMFPPSEAIGNKENFEKWKWEKAQKLAQFKAMPQIIAAQQRASRPLSLRPGGALVSPTGEVLHEQPALPKEYAPQLVDTPSGPQWVTPGQPVPSGTTGKTGVTSKGTPITREILEDYRQALKNGEAKPGGFMEWRAKKEAEKAKKVAEAKESTEGGKARVEGTKARTEATDIKTEKDKKVLKHLESLLPGEPGAAKPKTYTNPKTGETITEEEYKRRKAAAESAK